MIKETLSWMVLIACFLLVLICNQYLGYKLSEKNILKSCLTNNEFTIEGVKLICVKCATNKKAKEEE